MSDTSLLYKSYFYFRPSTKYELYQECGVKEYWLVYPYEKAVHQFVLNEQSEKYQLLNMYSGEDTATPQLFPDCRIDLRDVFEDDND